MSNFTFLAAEWPDVYEDAAKAEVSIQSDPRTSCFYARRAVEVLVRWMYRADASLRLPYQDNLSALIHEPSFKATVSEAVFNKTKLVTQIGNRAAHSDKKIPETASIAAVQELFHVCYWVAHTYARGVKPDGTLAFDQSKVPAPTAEVTPQTTEKLAQLEADLEARDEKLTTLLLDKEALSAELIRLRAEVAAAKKVNEQRADRHNYSEEQTRDYFIDSLLHEAGWPLDQPREREYEVSGMPNEHSSGSVDYVLWGDDGKPLGLVEAKRTKKNAKDGQQQAKLYADCLEHEFGQRPIIFYTNGYDHWIWDDANYAPRAVQGFYKKDELELLIQRRQSRRPLADGEVNTAIVARYYQTRAIRRISDAFDQDRERKALLVMATGAGKTRTVIALADLLMRCNWAKRILFLADRTALVNQALGAFKAHLPDSSPVSLVTDKSGQGRVYVSTYPTMMRLINELSDGRRRFGVGHFDLIVIDEAHRSVYQKYRAIFDYFDSLLVGLTATPKDEVDFNTYSLFDLERGVPTDAYDLEDAIKDGFLVPPVAVSVPIKFPREGITYNDLSDDEREMWDALDWDEDGNVPQRVEAAALNNWLFNEDTVDKALEHLMTRGHKVAGGDRLGKTIIFARNQKHADFIEARFNANYPALKGSFARTVYSGPSYAQSIIDDFSVAGKAPHIAISVDMLDTGIDVPEVVNLVFLKPVWSKTKFWQMVGRGTRLCPDVFGPGKDKENFFILDYCANLDFFSQGIAGSDGSVTASLTQRLFTTRLELIGTLDALANDAAALTAPIEGLTSLRTDTADYLHHEVASMNLENFIVRPQRQLVEKYAKPEPWTVLDKHAITDLATKVAGLPSELEPENEEAKRFDLLCYSLQLAVLNHEPGFDRMREQITAIAGLLEDQSAIPMIREQMALITDLQTDEWWQDVTVPILERVRIRLRSLVHLIEKRKRAVVYSDFEDERGVETEVNILGFDVADSFERFREKARAYLRSHSDHVAIYRVRTNKPLTPTDLTELERVLGEVGAPEAIAEAKDTAHGLGGFVRSLVGLDRGAAKEAFAEFLEGRVPSSALELNDGDLSARRPFTANQIHFIDMIINHLTDHGVMGMALLYESPFTDIAPRGPDGLFPPDEVDALVSVLRSVEAAAEVA